MKNKKKDAVTQVKHSVHSSEIPCLSIVKTTTRADFVTDNVVLEAHGWSVQECAEGIDFLLKRLKELKKDT